MWEQGGLGKLWLSGHLWPFQATSPLQGSDPEGKVTGWQANCNVLEKAPGRPLRRFPDQILDQRHMQTKPPGPA